ncbi:hypothetical protein E2C01_071975 [Portunus trituberculatus]|uniref:Uncharacterized protein n=1 Tax=Portunus trituberculatus TaxID=210409 RepID=A0A5B7I9F5_PORTR|nr:hypothetical protein [Portunus trituberculatus]
MVVCWSDPANLSPYGATDLFYWVYRAINPNLGLHSMHRDHHTINDRIKVSFTRFRVSGHSLAIKSGRWNRRGRGCLPIEERLFVELSRLNSIRWRFVPLILILETALI